MSEYTVHPWLGGFSTAGVLIHNSFQEWDRHPVSTAIETLDISAMEFPNITVCPPRNKYTSLNVDISLIDDGEFKLDDKTRKKSIDSAYHTAFEGFNFKLKKLFLCTKI